MGNKVKINYWLLRLLEVKYPIQDWFSRNERSILFLAGIVLLALGMCEYSTAQGLAAKYNDVRIAEAVNVIITYIEGSFGALIMVVSGIAAIMSAAFGQYRAALSLLVVAVGAFILRSIISTFFNDANIAP
ncbi:MAG: hypothetical protein D6719_10505 [Candidatus Dadabacteria bacterium]|nr:MAG: hypothetical protein D6719_10505 [Candidatus Dadabacteria bacterium]